MISKQPTPDGFSTRMTSQENFLLTKINQERTIRGKPSLAVSHRLTEIARIKARDMAVNKYVSHTSPTFGTTGEIIRKNGIRCSMVGENLAKAMSPSSAFSLFMKSSVHRANILSSRYNTVGIGVVPYSGGVMTAVIFANEKLHR